MTTNHDPERGLPPAYVLGAGVMCLGILRSLGARGVPVTVFGAAEDDIAYHSRFARVERLSGAEDSLAVARQVVAHASRAPVKPVLFVSGDSNLEIACEQQSLLSTALHVFLPTAEAARTVLQKDLFQTFAASRDLPVPRGWQFNSPEELGDFLARDVARFPLVMKPERSGQWRPPPFADRFGLVKMLRADSPEALEALWHTICALAGPPVVQEYVQGGDDAHFSYVSYIGRCGKELAGYTIKKHRLLPIHGGAATFASLVREPDIEALGRETVRQIGYRSVSSVCFKRDAVSGKPFIFEVNGRLPAAHAAGRLGGIDLPWLMYRDALGKDCDRVEVQNSRGKWLALTQDISAMRQYRRAGETSLAEWLLSLATARHVVEFDPADTGPFRYFLRSLLRRSR